MENLFVDGLSFLPWLIPMTGADGSNLLRCESGVGGLVTWHLTWMFLGGWKFLLKISSFIASNALFLV